MTSAVSPVDGLAGDYPREPRPATYRLAIGRLRIVTVLDGLSEQWGQSVDSVGALPVPAEPATRAFQVKLPVYSPAGTFNPLKDGRRLRRQLRGLVENDRARLEPVLWQWDADPEAAVWVVLGTGQLEDLVAGADVFAQWALSLDGAVRVGSLRTHRPARQLYARPLAGGSTPRDWKGLVVATDLAAATTLAIHGLPAASTAGRFDALDNLPVTANRTIRRTGNLGKSKTTDCLVVGQPNAATVSFGFDPADSGLGDVLAIDRRGLRETWTFGHSMNAGYGLTDPYRQRWTAARATVRNRGVDQNFAVNGSAVALDSTGGNGGYATMAQGFAVNNRDPSNPLMARGEWETVLDWNINDLAQLGMEGAPSPTTGNYEPYIRAMRYCISRSRSVAMCPINDSAGTSDASFAWSGSWTDNASTDKNSGTGWRRTTSGGFTWASPGVIKPGQTVALNGLAIPGNHKLTITATLIGAGETRTATFTVDGNAGAGWGNGAKYNAWCQRFADLVGGDTYTLTVTTSGAVGSGAGFDGVNVEFADRAAPQTLVFTSPRFYGGDVAYLLFYFSFPKQPTDATITQADQRLTALVGEFGGTDAGVCLCDLGGQLGTDLAARITADNVHPNQWGQKRIERAAWEGAERSGEEMYGPAHERLMTGGGPGDCPVLENGVIRVRPYMGSPLDPTAARATFAVDVPNATYPMWEEAGRIAICDQTSNGGAWSAPYTVLVGSQLVSYSPERATVRAVLARSPSDMSVTAEVFITLERGQSQFRVEVYGSSGRPGTSSGLGLAVRFVPVSAMAMAAGSQLAGVYSGDPGVTWNGTTSVLDLQTSLGFGAQPWVTLLNPSLGGSSVALTGLRGNHLWRCADDTATYGGTTRRAVQIEAPYGPTAVARGYCAATIGLINPSQLQVPAIFVRNTGSGTTSAVADAGSAAGSVVQDSQAADTNATLKISPVGLVPQRVLVLARLGSTAGGTYSLYHKFTGTGGTTSPTRTGVTPPVSLSGVLYTPLGEATLGTAGSDWELHAWRTGGAGSIKVDQIIFVPTEMRQAAQPTYDGASDHAARALLEHRTVPALTSKAV